MKTTVAHNYHGERGELVDKEESSRRKENRRIVHGKGESPRRKGEGRGERRKIEKKRKMKAIIFYSKCIKKMSVLNLLFWSASDVIYGPFWSTFIKKIKF